MMSKYITDEKLREIVYDFDNMDLDLDNMDLQEEHIFSDEHNKKMEAYFKELRRNKKKQSKRKIFEFNFARLSYKKVASVVVVVLCLSVLLFNSSTVMAYVNQAKAFIVQEFEKYSLFRVDDSNSKMESSLDKFVLNYESDTFKLEDNTLSGSYHIYNYRNDENKYFRIKIFKAKDKLDLFVDTENAEVSSKVIDGIEYESVYKDGVLRLFYFKGDYMYEIETDISIDEAFNEIKNIK